MKRTLCMASSLLVALTLLPSVAVAGDPCPIDFNFYEYGTPEWLDQNEILDGLETQAPLLGIGYRGADGGVEVTHVVGGSNAAKEGLEAGDMIVSINGEPAYTQSEADAVFDQSKVGDTMKLEVVRDGEVLLFAIAYGRQDPVLGALLRHIDAQECADVTRRTLSSEQLTIVSQAAFEGKRFNCEDAHEGLGFAAGTETVFEPGDIVVVRGSSRVLVANTGWATVCIKAASYDGDKLTPAKVESLFEKIAGDYIADRHDNP